MQHGNPPFRKPRPQNEPDKNPRSAHWREIGKLIGKGSHAEALSRINAMLAGGMLGASESAGVLCFVADVAFDQGKFDQATTTYQQAAGYPQDSAAWLRPVTGQVRSLLKSVRVAPAIAVATRAVTDSTLRQQNYQQSISQGGAAPVAGQGVVVPPKPLRLSVVATRMGRLFFQEGEVEAARALWRQALTIEPQGASKARIGLAEIALRENKPVEASQLASDALQVGKFRAKTLPALAILLKANAQQGISAVSPSISESLRNAKKGIRARGTLLLVTRLRALNNPAWLNIAQQWMSQDSGSRPREFAEFKKVILSAQSGIGGKPSRQLQAANDLRTTPGLSLREWLCGAKSALKAGMALRQPPDVSGLIQEGATRFGNNSAGAITHGLALACAKQQPALAKACFEQNVAGLPADSPVRAQSLWALAKLASDGGNYAEAAKWYSQYVKEPKVPTRLRLYAQIAWARCAFKSGQSDLVAAAKPAFQALLNQVDDFELALDLSRQLTLAPGDLHSLAESFRQRGETLAGSQLANAQTPSLAVTVLYKLARRQNDFGEYGAIASGWEAMDSTRKAWLWTNKSEFWEYLAIVVRAYAWMGNQSAAEAMVKQYLDDPATSGEARATLGVTYGLTLISRGQVSAGLACFPAAILESPTQPICGYAYYWQAMLAWKAGDVDGAKALAGRIQQAVGNPSALGWKVELTVRSMCFLGEWDERKILAMQSQYSAILVEKHLAVMQNDLGRL